MRMVRGLMLVALGVVLFAPAAHAQAVGQHAFEFYGGWINPGNNNLEANYTLGLRIAGRPLEKFGWAVSGGYMDLKAKDPNQIVKDMIGDSNAYMVDGDAIWYPGGSNWGVFGSLGFGHVNVSIKGQADKTDDAFTWGGGVNYTWNFGESYVVKPQFRFRQWEGDLYDKTDEEISLSFGWRL